LLSKIIYKRLHTFPDNNINYHYYGQRNYYIENGEFRLNDVPDFIKIITFYNIEHEDLYHTLKNNKSIKEIYLKCDINHWTNMKIPKSIKVHFEYSTYPIYKIKRLLKYRYKKLPKTIADRNLFKNMEMSKQIIWPKFHINGLRELVELIKGLQYVLIHEKNLDLKDILMKQFIKIYNGQQKNRSYTHPKDIINILINQIAIFNESYLPIFFKHLTQIYKTYLNKKQIKILNTLENQDNYGMNEYTLINYEKFVTIDISCYKYPKDAVIIKPVDQQFKLQTGKLAFEKLFGNIEIYHKLTNISDLYMTGSSIMRLLSGCPDKGYENADIDIIIKLGGVKNFQLKLLEIYNELYQIQKKLDLKIINDHRFQIKYIVNKKEYKLEFFQCFGPIYEMIRKFHFPCVRAVLELSQKSHTKFISPRIKKPRNTRISKSKPRVKNSKSNIEKSFSSLVTSDFHESSDDKQILIPTVKPTELNIKTIITDDVSFELYDLVSPPVIEPQPSIKKQSNVVYSIKCYLSFVIAMRRGICDLQQKRFYSNTKLTNLLLKYFSRGMGFVLSVTEAEHFTTILEKKKIKWSASFYNHKLSKWIDKSQKS